MTSLAYVTVCTGVYGRCVTVREQDDMAYIEARLPTHGEYGLEIYANEPMKEGDTFTHICQYLCSWLEKDFRAQYGQVFDREDMAYTNQTLPLALSYTGEQAVDIHVSSVFFFCDVVHLA